eukprot:TRINITY_DN22463_c0_g1_i1.p1 TRINITY_DN22463_c0_g1~~TRINITY_DN22463_c0_g1_i1.p1  ORF type:complete len:129 (+),score=48.65 TRINITY_DN22463_c0_g1_i1:52-438(+)
MSSLSFSAIVFFFFQAEDGIRDLVRSRGLGDVYKRQEVSSAKVITDKYSGRSKGFGFVEMADDAQATAAVEQLDGAELDGRPVRVNEARPRDCLLYTSDAADDLLCVDLGGGHIIKKKIDNNTNAPTY